MINQYSQYSSVPSQVVNIVSNKADILDDIVLIQTNQNEYTALLKNNVTKKCKAIKIYRTSVTNAFWQVSESNSTFDYNITNEYYVYSNIGLGQSIKSPYTTDINTYCLLFITLVLAFSIVFKGALFKCLKR